MKRIFFALSILFCSAIICHGYPRNFEDALKALDEALDKSDFYEEIRLSKNDSLKSMIKDDITSVSLYEAIGNNLRGVAVDSAIAYYDKGEQLAFRLGDTLGLQRCQLLKASLLPVTGAVKESLDLFNRLEDEQIHESNKEIYYESGNRLFFYISEFYPTGKIRTEYIVRGAAFTDSLVSFLPKGSVKYKFYAAQAAITNNDAVKARGYLDDVLEKTSIHDNMFACAASLRALTAQTAGNRHEESYYLTLSALSDAISGTREVTSLQRIGEILYKNGDIERAYFYLMKALDDAVLSGARIRIIESSQALPIISRAFREHDDRKMVILWTLVLLLLVSIATLGTFAFFLRQQKSKLELIRSDLAQSNHIKELYMNQFLNLSSIYMDRLEEFNKLAGRKIVAGQVEDLFKLIKSGKMLEEQHKLFFEVFDNAFMNIYPTFVDDVNQLLNPKKRIDLGDNVKLSPELRILALMRLGVNDYSQISRFTGLSLNTIYTYKTKMKSRAIDRENFEKEIMNIGQITQ